MITVHCRAAAFTFEEIEVDGVIKTKIVRDDGRYAIVERARDPRVVEHYHADGKLHAVRNRSTGERTITRETRVSLVASGRTVAAIDRS